MNKVALFVAATMLAGAGCAPQSRVDELETRVQELEELVLELKAPDFSKVKLPSVQVRIPHRDCVRPGLAVWEKNGSLGCLSPKVSHMVEGYDAYFPPAKGCIGQFVIMGAESLTCDTPEHPYH